jgi:hypothetical protein
MRRWESFSVSSTACHELKFSTIRLKPLYSHPPPSLAGKGAGGLGFPIDAIAFFVREKERLELKFGLKLISRLN